MSTLNYVCRKNGIKNVLIDNTHFCDIYVKMYMINSENLRVCEVWRFICHNYLAVPSRLAGKLFYVYYLHSVVCVSYIYTL